MPINAAEDTNTTNSSYYNETTFDPQVAGDVTQDPEITSNIAQTDYAKKIEQDQKQGSTILQFGNGTGNKLLIWAGIHGNEEEANISNDFIEITPNEGGW